MRKTTKVITMSVLTIAMCISLIAGATLALFTSEDDVDIVVSSGKVDVGAAVSGVQYASDTSDEYPEEVWKPATVEGDGVYVGTFETKGNLRYEESINQLALNNIAPGDAVKFNLQVVNNSTIAIKYLVRIDVVKDEGGLLELLRIEADGERLSREEGSPMVVSDWITVEASSGSEATIKPIEMFIALPSAATSAQAADKNCTLRLTVVAVQSNAHTCTEGGGHSFNEDDVCTWCGQENIFNHEDTSDTYTIKGLKPKFAGLKNIEIPSSVNGKQVEIAAGAFKDNTTLESVEIADGIKEIPNSAFALSNDEIAKNAKLKSVKLPSDLVSIGAAAFTRCEALTDCDLSKCTSLERIGTNAFALTGIESVKLPESLQMLGSGAFCYCSELTSVELNETLPGINSATFTFCTALKKITLPDSITYIGVSAFDRSGITEINFPEGLTEIGKQAFMYCDITAISLPDTVEKIDTMAFAYCTEVTTIKLSSALSAIPHWGFRGCTSVKELAIPDSVVKISLDAFSNCNALSEITIPKNVKTITLEDDGKYKYHGTIKVAAENENFEVAGDSNLLINKATHTLLWAKADVTSVEIPTDVTRIGDYAFYCCTELASIGIPTNVTEIGLGAFKECSALATINLHGGITSIGASAFASTKYYNTKDKWSGGSVGTGVLYLPVGEQEHYYLLTANGISDATESLQGTVVIAESAFSSTGSKLTTVTIPESVKVIGKRAFSSCSSLANVTIPGTVSFIGENAFSKNTKITIDSTNERYKYKVVDVDREKWSYVIDTEIMTLLFATLDEGCTSVTIPEGVKRIGESAFANCAELTEIVIAESVTEVAENAFSSCKGLLSVTFKGATKIGDEAFWGCVSLHTIKFEKDGDLSFQEDTFLNCFDITEIVFNGTTDRWIEILKQQTNGAFVYLEGEITVKCSNGSLVMIGAEVQ